MELRAVFGIETAEVANGPHLWSRALFCHLKISDRRSVLLSATTLKRARCSGERTKRTFRQASAPEGLLNDKADGIGGLIWGASHRLAAGISGDDEAGLAFAGGFEGPGGSAAPRTWMLATLRGRWAKCNGLHCLCLGGLEIGGLCIQPIGRIQRDCHGRIYLDRDSALVIRIAQFDCRVGKVHGRQQ